MANGAAETSARVAALAGADHLQSYRDKDAAGLDGTAEVDAAVTAFREAFAAAATDSATAPAYAYNLALALQSRYDAVGEPRDDDSDLREAVVLLDGAVAAVEHTDSPYKGTLWYGLGAALRRLHRVARDVDTLHRAVGLLGDALRLGALNQLDEADCLYEYGRALLTLTERDEDQAVLDEAIRAFDELVDHVDPEAPDRAAYLDAAGSARLMRFDRDAHDDDLTRAVELAREAVRVQSDRGRPTAAALADLAGALFSAGIRRAAAAPELDEAAVVAREALDIARRAVSGTAPAGREACDRLAGIESNLAGILLARLERSGDLAYLDEIADLCTDAVHRSAPNTRALGLRAHQLAVARRTRFLRTDRPDDLEAAIAAHKIARQCPVTGSERRVLLDSLGNSLRTRFDTFGDVDDLQTAVAAYDEALAEPGGDSPDRAARLMNLGAALAALADMTNDLDAGERARSTLVEAVDSTAAGSLEHARALINLGNVLAERYNRTRQPEDRDAAETAYRQVRRDADLSAVSTESVMQAALNAGDWAVERTDWPAAVDWLERALEAVEELVVIQRRRPDKESWLRDARGAAIRAASAAISIGDRERAVTLVERGRALMLSEAMQQSHLDLDALDAAGAHDLRMRLAAAARTTGWSEPGTTPGNPAAPFDLRLLRDEIRRIPGFESFLTAPGFENVAAAASPLPLVYLISGDRSGFAMVVAGRSVVHVTLQAMTARAVRRRAEQVSDAYEEYLADPTGREAWVRALDEVADWLWSAVAAPLLPHLPAKAVNIVAGGLLGLLPLHAAACSDPQRPGGRRYLLDELRISYVPNARALTAIGPRLDWTADDQLLAIADPQPSTLAPLLGTQAESRAAASAFSPPGPAPVVLAEAEADVDAVAAALQACDVAHFGCHGMADVTAPLSSALLLSHDVPLTVGDILALQVDLRLVVLSACETARPGTALPDEMVSMPTALIQAGAAGVVATGWAVPDAPTAALVVEFYRRWRWERKSPADALAGAQRWIRDTTNHQKADTWQRAVTDKAPWLPTVTADMLLDVYLLREPDALDDAGIDVWGGFAHYGR